MFNPNVTRFLRSGDVADRGTFALFSTLASMKSPHTLLLPTDSNNAGLRSVPVVQTQIAVFFESEGRR